MAGGCFTDVVLHSSKNYHQEHATESRRLPKTVAAAWSGLRIGKTATRGHRKSPITRK